MGGPGHAAQLGGRGGGAAAFAQAPLRRRRGGLLRPGSRAAAGALQGGRPAQRQGWRHDPPPPRLRSNNLSDLPDDLDQLQYLRVVRLKYNQLKRLPAVLLRLPQLMTLELSGNQVGGAERAMPLVAAATPREAAPAAAMHAVDAVASGPDGADMAACGRRPTSPPGAQVAELGEGVAAWQQLRELDLSGNQLAALPAGLCTLPRLEVRSRARRLLRATPLCAAQPAGRAWSGRQPGRARSPGHDASLWPPCPRRSWA